jgi:hypothetical protein
VSELPMNFAETHASCVDCSGSAPTENVPWVPVIITREAIEAEVERLAALPTPVGGRRESLIVHQGRGIQLRRRHDLLMEGGRPDVDCAGLDGPQPRLGRRNGRRADHPGTTAYVAMEWLLWQESMKFPPALLGAQLGFDTNRQGGRRSV